MAVDLDGAKQNQLVDAIRKHFGVPDAASVWIQLWIPQDYPGENVFNIFVGATFDAKTVALIKWVQDRGGVDALLQRLADRGDKFLAGEIFVISGGQIRPKAQGEIPPVEPHRDWFVTKRPFANRQPLRDVLAVFDVSPAGPESVLVIDGEHSTGKTFSVRFAKQCAPPGRYVSVDVAQFESGQMNIVDLAQALAPKAGGQGFPPVDLTKEHEAVPRVLLWLISNLSNANLWLIVDHCERPNLTEAARSLLVKLASAIDDLDLPGVRLILSEMTLSRLSENIRNNAHRDTAVLPDEVEVRLWCKELAAHLARTCSDADAASLVGEVFKEIPTTAKEGVPFAIEEGLKRAASRILALPKQP